MKGIEILMVMACLFAVSMAQCNNTEDIAAFKAHWTDFRQLVTDCGTKCFARIACATACTKRSVGLSQGCAACFGSDIGCMADHCMAQCTAAPTSQKCMDCHAKYCEVSFKQCVAVPDSVLPP